MSYDREYYRQAKLNGRYERQLARDRERYKPKRKEIVCSQCGARFIGKSRQLCSDDCRRSSRRSYKCNQNHRRNVRRRGGFVSTVRRKEIYQRDGWICRICLKKVNPRLRHPHALAASLDHIVPISKGGTHEPKNVQLAHWICNVTRRDVGPAQLRLI